MVSKIVINQEELSVAINELAAEAFKQISAGKKYHLSGKIKRNIRSVKQNSLYWMWLQLLSDETGNETNDLHELFKSRFGQGKALHVAGIDAIIPKSTTGYDTKEFTDYLEKIHAQAAHYGISLPYPEDDGWQDFVDTYG